MLTLSHVPAQHFISFQDEATSISMSSVSLPVAASKDRSLPSPPGFHHGSEFLSSQLSDLRVVPQPLLFTSWMVALQLGVVGVWGIVFWRSLCHQ